jgi:N-acetyl sugar amidotransferase
MKNCTSCLLPETHETITFNKKGSCNVCSNFKYKNKKIDWKKKKIELDNLINQFKGKNDYDCIVPFSGGKDSTWTLYYLIKKYNIKPLVVRFDHSFFRPNLENNVKKISRKLGVDIITFTPNWKVVQKLMLQSLLEKGDFCWHCHTGIFSYPMQVAIEKKIPLIFWGEPSAEYTAYYSHSDNESVDEKRFNRFINLGMNVDDMYLRLKGSVDIRDLKPYSYPSEKDLKNINCTSVCLGSFINWDNQKQSKIIQKELGWQGDEVENVPSNYNYEKIECYMQGVRDYLKFIKRGYSRPSHLVAIDLRKNRITLKEAKKIKKEFEGKRPPSLDLFLNFIGLNEEEFIKIAITHQVSPHIYDPNKTVDGKKTKDFSHWNTEGSMNKNYSKKVLSNWKKKYSD